MYSFFVQTLETDQVGHISRSESDIQEGYLLDAFRGSDFNGGCPILLNVVHGFSRVQAVVRISIVGFCKPTSRGIVALSRVQALYNLYPILALNNE